MAHVVNMEAAARRHLEAADCLKNDSRNAVAGYIYGLAAECAVKAMMKSAGVGTKDAHSYYVHFPRLRTELRDKLNGRKAQSLAFFISDDRFMSNWSIEMRYTDGKSIKKSWVETWAKQARQIVASIGS